MGARKLKSWIESPLNDRKAILERQGAVAALRDDLAALGEVRKMLQGIHDLQRVATIICSTACSPKNILMLKSSILRIGEIKECAVLSQSAYLQKIQNQIDDLADLYTLIDQAIDDEAPLPSKTAASLKQAIMNKSIICAKWRAAGRKCSAKWKAKKGSRQASKI